MALSKVTTYANHLAEIDQLSQRTETTTQTQTTPSQDAVPTSVLSPYVVYLPLVLFLLLFITAFGMLVMNKVHSAKNVAVGLVIALFAACIPTTITFLQQSGGQITKAGPNETPRQVVITSKDKESAIVTWMTVANVYGGVRYSLAPYTANRAVYRVSDNAQATTAHAVVIPNLTKGTAYELEIQSGTGWYDNGGTYVRFIFQP
jgi:uncharacterized membrane protein